MDGNDKQDVFYGQPDEDVEGHVRPMGLAPDEDDDDVEGHRVSAVAQDDDDDDVEGHRVLR